METLLRDERTNITSTTDRGSALHLAAQAGELKICQLLLLTDVSLLLTKNAQGKTAMDVDTKTPIKNLLERYNQVAQTEQVTYEFDDPS